MSAYFLDLEGLLNRIDSATTYYQILGVDRADDQEEIKASFQQLLGLLYPPYVIGRTIPADVSVRIERAFTKASQAFAALASFEKRKSYDDALLSITSKPIASNASKQSQRAPNESHVKQIEVAKNGDRPSDSAMAKENYDLDL